MSEKRAENKERAIAGILTTTDVTDVLLGSLNNEQEDSERSED